MASRTLVGSAGSRQALGGEGPDLPWDSQWYSLQEDQEMAVWLIFKDFGFTLCEMMILCYQRIISRSVVQSMKRTYEKNLGIPYP